VSQRPSGTSPSPNSDIGAARVLSDNNAGMRPRAELLTPFASPETR
jgi:hypothetical protein